MGTSAFRLGASQADVSKLQETITQSSHGFAAGTVIRSAGLGDGSFVAAQADSATNAEGVGIVSECSTNTFTVVYQGELISEGLTGHNEGTVLFLSADVAGGLSDEPPSLPGQVIKAMVIVNDTNEGVVVNYIGTTIGGESSIEVSNLQPVGTVIPWAGATGSEPVGWLVCDGATYSSTTGAIYSDLFDVIGIAFGGSGTTGGGVNDWFSVPNMMGRVPVGAGAGSGLTQRVLGASGGAESSDASIASGGTIDTAGSPTAMVSVMQPFTVTNYLIRYEQNSRASISGLLLDDLADAGTTGATAGDILQYEGNGTSGVYESVSINEALTGGITVLGGTGTFEALTGAAGQSALNFDGNINLLNGILQVVGNPVMNILQIVDCTRDTADYIEGLSGMAETNVGLRLNITPKSASSKIIIFGNVSFRVYSEEDANYGGSRVTYSIYKDQTGGLTAARSGGSLIARALWRDMRYDTPAGGADAWSGARIPFTHLHTPGNTTAFQLDCTVDEGSGVDSLKTYIQSDYSQFFAVEID